ncbi:ribonuclease HII [Flavobacteriaceae bacterium SZ-1-7]|uniref:ribonuclease HII n=1 Tax=Tamlana sedimenti TaxID=3134126 RepID=UPI0031280789
MKFFWLSLLLITVFNCANPYTERTELIDYAPEKASIILSAPNLESLKSSIKNSEFLQTVSNTSCYRSIEDNLSNLSHLKPSGEILLCFLKDDNDSLQYAVITKQNQNLFKRDSLPNYTEELISFKSKAIVKSTLNKNTFYSLVIDSTFFASSSLETTKGLLNESSVDEQVSKIFNTSSKEKTFSVIVKSNDDFIKSVFIEDSLSLANFTNHLALDVELSQNETYFNGITKATDSSESLINIFKNTIPQQNQIQNATPSNSDGFMSFTFDNYKIFETNLKKFNKKDSIANTTTLFDNIIEVGVLYEDKNRAVVLNSIDIIATNDALLSEQTKIDSYREIDIFSFSKPRLFSETFSPLVSYKNANMYCVLDDFFVFTDNLELLQSIIANYQNETVLGQKDYFKNMSEKLSSAASLLQVCNSSTLKTIVNKNLETEGDFEFKSYNVSAIQFIYDHDFAHLNGIISKNKAKASANSISEELNIKLDADLLTNPQFVKNHRTNEKEIVVQDVNNNLYLISNSGKILWKKQLQGPALGTIEQIDIYKNGRLQLIFATPNRVYVLDRNGKDVSPFPLNFNDKITQPLSVFDYDKRKNYRLLVTQSKHVLMYNVQGQIVKGFTFNSANDDIISQPKHFRIGSKDYITIKTENKFYILDRIGKIRVKPKSESAYSNQPVFLYNDKFTTTTADGDLVSVDSRGNVSKTSLNLSSNHSIETTSKTLVTLSENKLSIKSKTSELDFGNYTQPRIFYIYDKIYVSTTDLQSHKIYLYDSQSKMIDNFPVYGNSVIELDNIDRDRNLEFVTKGESNSIILYQIN